MLGHVDQAVNVALRGRQGGSSDFCPGPWGCFGILHKSGVLINSHVYVHSIGVYVDAVGGLPSTAHKLEPTVSDVVHVNMEALVGHSQPGSVGSGRNIPNMPNRLQQDLEIFIIIRIAVVLVHSDIGVEASSQQPLVIWGKVSHPQQIRSPPKVMVQVELGIILQLIQQEGAISHHHRHELPRVREVYGKDVVACRDIWHVRTITQVRNVLAAGQAEQQKQADKIELSAQVKDIAFSLIVAIFTHSLSFFLLDLLFCQFAIVANIWSKDNMANLFVHKFGANECTDYPIQQKLISSQYQLNFILAV